MDAVALGLGVFLLALTFWDLFQTVVVPRPTPGWFRIGRYLVRGSWRVLRRLRDGDPGRSYDRVLGLFAPAATIALLAAWLVTLIVGYGLILYALRGDLRPVPVDLGTALYFAATSAADARVRRHRRRWSRGPRRHHVAAISGLGVVALVVTFLFSLYASYQRREMRVVTLQAAAGAPPSAVALLEAYAQLDLVERLPDLFREWQTWAAEVLDSHVAYPLLGYFRSSHDNLSWISALGTVLDASSLVLTTVRGIPRGDAKLFKRMGTHLVEDIYNLGFRGDGPPSTGRPSTPRATAWRRRAISWRRATSRGRRSSPPGGPTPGGWRRWPPTGRRPRRSGWVTRLRFASRSTSSTTPDPRPPAGAPCRPGPRPGEWGGLRGSNP